MQLNDGNTRIKPHNRYTVDGSKAIFLLQFLFTEFVLLLAKSCFVMSYCDCSLHSVNVALSEYLSIYIAVNVLEF